MSDTPLNPLSRGEFQVERFADCRYQGQEHTVTVPVLEGDFEGDDLQAVKERFDDYHQQAYAHNLPTHSAEIVNLRLRALGITQKPHLATLQSGKHSAQDAIKGSRMVYFDGQWAECPVYDRLKFAAGHTISGPAIIEEWTSTILIRPKQAVTVDQYGNLVVNLLRNGG